MNDDVRLAGRALVREPAFALAVIGTIALAMGVTTGVFGVIDALALRPLPGVEAGGLVNLYVTRHGSHQGFSGFSGPTYRELRERSRTLADLQASVGRGLVLGDDAGSSVVGGQLVSGGFFRLLGTRAHRGRLLTEHDDQPGADSALVISEPLWRQRFGGAEDVVGTMVRVGGRPFTVVGITEPGFRGHFVGFPMDAYLPLSASALVAPEVDLEDRAADNLELLGRLRAGTAVAATQADLRPIAADLARTFPESHRGLGVEVRAFTGFDAELRGPVLGFVGLLAVVGGLVLLVACLNVASLTLARAVVRGRDLAVRAALGAGRGHLIRTLLAESLLLFTAGGTLGAALAQPAADALQRFLPDFPIPLRLDVGLDLRVGLFALASTLLAALACGLAPAAAALRLDVVHALKHGGRGVVAGPRRARRVFLAAQVAVSLVLLVGSGLFLRELQRAWALDPGFRPDGVSLVTVDLGLLNRSPEARRTFFERWIERVRARPGVEAASLARVVPLGLGRATTRIHVDGQEAPEPEGFTSGWNAVTPGYFETLGIPLLTGRDFDRADAFGAPAVAIVSRSTAARLFPGQDPLGRHLRHDGQTLSVVGTVDDIVVDRSQARDGLFVYVPLAQSSGARASLLWRGPLPPRDVREEASALDSDLPALTAMSLRQHTGAALFPQRLAAMVSGAFGIFGLILAAVGLYGLGAYLVVQRRQELAVRAALGAQGRDLRLMVLREGLGPVGTGTLLGLVGALAFGRLAAGFVPAVGPFDAASFAGGALLLLVVATLAADLPARRAATAAPADLLRSE